MAVTLTKFTPRYKGPFNMRSEGWLNNVSGEIVYGNYQFGTLDKDQNFVPKYVGRSDSGLRKEINQQKRLKESEGKRYTHFRYKEAFSKKQAYENECKDFHNNGEKDGLDNEYHPDKPDGTDYKCPICGQ